MKHVAELLNELMSSGILVNYAVFGAVAQMRYTDAVATMDADILVAVQDPERIDLLAPIYDFCRGKGLNPEGECVRVGAWPVQFVPAFNPLTEEALAQAEQGDVDGVPLRVVSADYLAAIALQTGRAKDLARIVALNDARALDMQHITDILARHGLSTKWQNYREKYLDA